MIDRRIAPTIQMPNQIQLVKAKKINLDNGLLMHVLSGCTEPIVNLTIIIPAGKYFQKNELAAFFMSLLMKKGTQHRNAKMIENSIDFEGATIHFSSNMFNLEISLNCLEEKLEKVMPILLEVLTESIFPEEELALEKNKQKQKLKINNEKIDYLASVYFNQAIFGENHPIGGLLSIEKIDALERAHLLTHFNEQMVFNAQTHIILAGDITEKTTLTVNHYLGKLPIKPNIEKSFIPFEPTTNKIQYIEKKKSIQSSIRIGSLIALKSTDDELLELDVLNRILGGYFGSRLMKKIREEKAYTYGIYSYISSFKEMSYFCIATDVGVAYREDTIYEISQEILRLKTERISSEELAMVKNYHKGRIMKSVDGPTRMANVLASYLPLDLTEEYKNKQLHTIDNISAERIMDLANKYLHFEEMHQVIVG